jgi:hypothetical protein
VWNECKCEPTPLELVDSVDLDDSNDFHYSFHYFVAIVLPKSLTIKLTDGQGSCRARHALQEWLRPSKRAIARGQSNRGSHPCRGCYCTAILSDGQGLSRRANARHALQEWLRPVFCPPPSGGIGASKIRRLISCVSSPFRQSHIERGPRGPLRAAGSRNFVLNAPSFSDWGKIWDAYQDDSGGPRPIWELRTLRKLRLRTLRRRKELHQANSRLCRSGRAR